MSVGGASVTGHLNHMKEHPCTTPTTTPGPTTRVRPSAQTDLVTHLVFVGGRLAESWSEDAAESKYAEFARSLAAERRRVEPPSPPVVPAHVQLLEWLDEQAAAEPPWSR